MKKTAFMFVLLFASAGAAQAQSCNCTTTPFLPDPPCWNVCTVGLLASVGLDQLVQVIGVRESVARKIVDWPYRSSVSSFQDYRAILTEEELAHVAAKINSLSDWQLKELRTGSPYSSNLEVSASPGRTAVLGMMKIENQSKEVERAAVNRTAPRTATGDTTAEVTYYYYKDKKAEWRWKVKAANGRVIAESAEGYKTERECLEDIERVKHSSDSQVKTE